MHADLSSIVHYIKLTKKNYHLLGLLQEQEDPENKNKNILKIQFCFVDWNVLNYKDINFYFNLLSKITIMMTMKMMMLMMMPMLMMMMKAMVTVATLKNVMTIMNMMILTDKSKSKKLIVYLHKSHDFCTAMEYLGMIILSMLLSLQNKF